MKRQWKNKKDVADIPDTALNNLKNCHKDMFLIKHLLLIILSSFPVSAISESSFCPYEE